MCHEPGATCRPLPCLRLPIITRHQIDGMRGPGARRAPGGAASLLRLGLIAACALVAPAIDVEGGGPRPPRPATGAPSTLAQGAPGMPGRSTVGEVREQVGRYVRMYQGFVSACAKASRFINVGSGCMLAVSCPFAVLGSVLTGRIPEAFLVGFLAYFGLLLAGVELPIPVVQRMLQNYFRFMYTTYGRLGFTMLVASVAWACNQVSPVTKLLLSFQALLAFYVLNSSSSSKAFASSDAAVRDDLNQAASELRDTTSAAMSFANVVGLGGLAGKFGLGKSSPAPSRPAVGRESPYAAAAGHSSPYADAQQQQPPASPWGDTPARPKDASQPNWDE